jgi:hypothetical protein
MLQNRSFEKPVEREIMNSVYLVPSTSGLWSCEWKAAAVVQSCVGPYHHTDHLEKRKNTSPTGSCVSFSHIPIAIADSYLPSPDPDPDFFVNTKPDPGFFCGSGHSSRFFNSKTKKCSVGKKEQIFFFIQKIAFHLVLGIHEEFPCYRRTLRPSKENIQHVTFHFSKGGQK